jgi:hypothetical protein
MKFEMKFDGSFYIQRNTDNFNLPISLADFDNCQMRGTEKYPVIKIGMVEELEIDYQLLQESLSPLNEIKLRIIMVCDRIPKDFKGFSYYMQFAFYDFNREVYLFLFNAKLVEIKTILRRAAPKNLRVLTIVSSGYGEMPAYKVFEVEHQSI